MRSGGDSKAAAIYRSAAFSIDKENPDRDYGMFVSIIIPTKDEPAIQELIDEIEKTIKQDHEIIIVDKSRVRPKINGAKVISQSSDGLGNAFVEGLSQARGDALALMDGDGSHRPEDLNNLLSRIGEAEIVLGSKLIDGGRSSDAPCRKAVTLAFSLITRSILWLDIKDPMTGFMVAKKDVFNRIDLKPRGFKVVIETVYKSKAKVIEVPINFRERKMGFSKAGFNIRGLNEMSRIIILLLELKWGRLAGKW
jgi:dolichol-phosphate mannosyltransferase